MTGAPAPRLAVVVPSVNGWRDLEGCLEALERESRAEPLEVLVPERCGPEVRSAVARKFATVRVLPVERVTSIPAMRARAFAAATAPTVAVIEDHVRVPAGWAGTILAARDAGARVVGGTLVNTATRRVVDWAAFFTEYSQLCPPLRPGPADWLTGNNVAYDRRLLEEFRGLLDTEPWEGALHAAFRARGIVLWCQPDLVAEHQQHVTVGGYLSQRFLYSRAYAGARLGGRGSAARLGYGVLALGLPPVLLARIVSRVWRGGAHRGALLRALPLLALCASAWAVGEVAGAWFGAGDALARVK